MGYRNLAECVRDLEQSGQLVHIESEVDPSLEAAEIQRRVYQSGGPAIFYARVRGCRFPMVSNLFGTKQRTRFLFRDTLAHVRRLVELKIDPTLALKRAWRYRKVPATFWRMQPKMVNSGPVLKNTTTIDQLPQVTSWPRDGGPFVTLPRSLHRRSRPSRLCPLEPGHVPNSVGGRKLSAEPGSRPALPDPPLDRTAPRGRHSSRESGCG